MNPSTLTTEKRDLLLRAVATLGMILDLIMPIFGIACGVIALSLTFKGSKEDWKNPDIYYAIAVIVLGVFVMFAVYRMNITGDSSASSL